MCLFSEEGFQAKWFIGLEIKKVETSNGDGSTEPTPNINLTEPIQRFTNIVYNMANQNNTYTDDMSLDVKWVRRSSLEQYLPPGVVLPRPSRRVKAKPLPAPPVAQPAAIPETSELAPVQSAETNGNGMTTSASAPVIGDSASSDGTECNCVSVSGCVHSSRKHRMDDVCSQIAQEADVKRRQSEEVSVF